MEQMKENYSTVYNETGFFNKLRNFLSDFSLRNILAPEFRELTKFLSNKPHNFKSMRVLAKTKDFWPTQSIP